jgi:glycerol-3-phosphate responsive antiterminator
MEYHKTRDILYVIRLLGHRNIKNTLIHTQLIDGIQEDEYLCRVAKNPTEIQELVEAGYEYICETPELKFFRKRK